MRPEATAGGTGEGGSRSARRDAEARARLVPLEPGERPRAVTIAALAALVLGVGNLIAHLATMLSDEPALGPAGFTYSILALALFVGLWRVRYFAVLITQALLAFLVTLFAVLLAIAENLVAAALSLIVIAAAGALFWFLVKAMARIQTPRPEEEPGSERIGSPDG